MSKPTHEEAVKEALKLALAVSKGHYSWSGDPSTTPCASYSWWEAHTRIWRTLLRAKQAK